MTKMNRVFGCLAVLSTGSLLAQSPAEVMSPFVIPGLATPATRSVVDVSWLNDKPAGGHGFVRVRDGHFVDGQGKRLRFLVSNYTFGSCFPDQDTADQLAARLASLGINCIRFHHTDNQAAPGGIWKAGTPKKNEFDPGQLDRLDYFIAALQDSDGLFQFDWGGTEPDSRRITGYFSLQQHPAKLAFLPVAALMFRRGDVEAVRATARLALPADEVESLTAESVSMSGADHLRGHCRWGFLRHCGQGRQGLCPGRRRSAGCGGACIPGGGQGLL